MARSEITVNASEFIKRLEKTQLEFHMEIMRKIPESMDRIRNRAATKYIRARSVPKGPFRRMYALQPSIPDKLTERTGFLKRVLTSKGSWTITKRMSKLQASRHLNFWVRPQTVGRTFVYLGLLAIMEKGHQGLKYRLRNETHGDRRGKIRPFMEPAFEDEKEIMRQNLHKLVSRIRTI